MRINNGSLTFDCSGRVAWGAACDVIGLDVTPTEETTAWWRIKGGFDNQIKAPWDDDAPNNQETALTADEMRELADFMIQHWTAFRDSLPHVDP